MPEIVITSNAWEIADKMNVLATLLIPNLTTAMGLSLDALQFQAVDFMYSHFKGIGVIGGSLPSKAGGGRVRTLTGALEGAFYQVTTPGLSSLTGELINPLSYAWRREMGFSGMTDSLGRAYADDPGIAYMHHTIADPINLAVVREYFVEGINVSLVGMGVVP